MLTMTATTMRAQIYLDPQAPMEERIKDALSRMTIHEKIQVIHAQSKFTSAGVPRLGIRQLNMDDGSHGVREELGWNSWSNAGWTNDSVVAFPSLTCLASTWNRDLSARYGHALSEEFAFRGKDVLLGPGVNIARTPMNGRAFEYMGEDPCLAGEMVVPYILSAQKNGVACCLKHYVLNDQEVNRFGTDVMVGENTTRSLTQGGGSSELKTLRDISPLKALRSQCSMDYAQGYTSGRALYDQVDTVDQAESERLKAEALEKARQADLIIYIGGLNKNTKQDCENSDRESYDLSFGQNELISQLAQIQPNIVVVTFGGNAYATPWLQQVKALVHCWYLGSESGTSLANMLTVKVNPSGKLPVTFAKRYDDYPYVHYGKEAYQDRSGQVDYKEGIYVGYRGFERNKKQPQFPFGYGLSYTTFQYGQPTAQVSGDHMNVEVTIQNTGSVAGKEVAQVYVSAPKNKQMDKPVKELKGFAKTRLLQPGESETLRISIPCSELASWNEATHEWQVDNGTYTLQVGASSAEIRGKAKISL